MLVKTKEELENELFHLKDELDAASFARHGSVRQNLSYSSLESTEAEVSVNVQVAYVPMHGYIYLTHCHLAAISIIVAISNENIAMVCLLMFLIETLEA